MPKDYGSWSLSALKAELRRRNAKVTGKKAVLVQRLFDYDVIFGSLVNDPDTTYRIAIPGPEKFLDINSATVLPNVTEAAINQYCLLTETENFNKSKNMYNERYLLSSRAAQDGENYFVTAMCAAEMRKNIVYNVTIKFENNTMVETQCECAAGMGPHAQCKHVLVVMWGIEEFTQSKKIKLRTSPTSSLQTFHQPTQFYSGEPVQAEFLKLKKKDDTLKAITTFDPRTNIPDNKKYNERFFNKCINFVGYKNAPGMPILQLSKAANKIGLNNDHDYLEKSMEDMFLDSLYLNEEQRNYLEHSTRCDKKKWREERLKRIQSSNFGKICRTNNFLCFHKNVFWFCHCHSTTA